MVKLSEKAREARNAYKRSWQEKNRGKYNAYMRRWKKENPDKVKEYQAAYWEKKAREMTDIKS